MRVLTTQAARSLGFRASIPLLLACLLGLLVPQASRAEQLTLSIDPSSTTIAAGGTGSFDVLLSNALTNNTTFNVSAFGLELQLPNLSGITFTSALIPVSNYIFQGNSADQNLGIAFVQNTNNATPGNFPATEVSVFDSTNPGGAPSTSLAPGSSFDLGTFNFAVATTAAAGTYDISNIDAGMDSAFGTLFSDPLGNAVPYTYDGGSIIIQGGTVPEPASLVLAGLGGIGALAMSRRRKRQPIQPVLA